MEKMQKPLISDKAYLDWIENFTQNYKEFTTDNFQSYNADEIDKTNVAKIYTFFQEIRKYADTIGVKDSSRMVAVESYIFRYKGIYYRISEFMGHELFCRIEIIKPKANDRAIDLTELYKIKENDLLIETTVDTIIKLMDEKIQKANVPKEVILIKIKERIKNSIEEIIKCV